MVKRILNAGCGKDTYGTDFVDIYPSRKEVIKCNLQKEKLPFRNSTFDEVYAKSVFEHLKNPGNFIQECKRVLKKKGKLIIITDNAGHYRFHLQIFKKDSTVHYGEYEKKGKFGLIRSGPEDKHYLLFTTLHLRNFLMDNGFKVLTLKYPPNEHSGWTKPMNYALDYFVGLIDKRIVTRFVKIVGEKQ